MKILFYGLNYAPEELGIGKYSGEMIRRLAEEGHTCVVVTTPPYYPQWKVSAPFTNKWFRREFLEVDPVWMDRDGEGAGYGTRPQRRTRQCIEVIRCPLWVPKRVNGLKRIVHLLTFGVSSAPVLLWKALTWRPDVIMTVEPAACGLPMTRLAGRLCKAKTWLHVQDFEVDAAFDLGILKSPLLQKVVLRIEALLMRRFDVVSSISPNMLTRLTGKRVRKSQMRLLPNWVDCDAMRPLKPAAGGTQRDMRRSLRSRYGIPEDRFVALYAGNIGAKQGLGILADAAKVLALDGQCGEHGVAARKIHFVICGHGAAFPALKEAVAGLDNVQLLPVQPFEQFNGLMNCADVHLLPQKAGAADLVMPSKLTGMLATGRPVVACAAPKTQIAEVVADRGVVVGPGDPEAFARAVQRLAEDPESCRRFGEQARHYAMEHLGREAILGRLIEDLDGLVYGGHAVAAPVSAQASVVVKVAASAEPVVGGGVDDLETARSERRFELIGARRALGAWREGRREARVLGSRRETRVKASR